MSRNFLFHLHPLKVTRRVLHPVATLGLGLITLTSFLVLVASGALLMIYYVPTPEGALASMQDIQYAVAYGAFVRGLHRLAAHVMVFAAFAHMGRVCFTSAYHGRPINWFVGLVLLALTLGLAFTGYLLPWDQLAFWAVRVSTNLADHVPLIGVSLKRLLLGGDQVGAAALNRFYMLHVALLPGLIFCLIAYHLWRIRSDGGLARSLEMDEAKEEVPAWPHLILREAVVAICVVTILFLLAISIDFPLGGFPDAHHPSNPEKTPWYFLGLQEMVSYSAIVGGFIFPGLLFLVLAALPFVDREPVGVGRWFGAPKGRTVAVVSTIVALVCVVLFEALFLKASSATWISDLLNPATCMLLAAVSMGLVSGRLTRSLRNGILSCVLVLFVALIGFTFVAWCRGPGWVFYWPWEAWPGV
jgi:cytochrome b-561